MADIDMSQYVDLFLQEANEQLEILEQETLKLEKEPSLEHLQVIFRAAHTLKGSSRAMGFEHFAEVTHEMENLLELLRSNQLPVTTSAVDVLFECLDVLSTIKDKIAAQEGDEFECSSLVGKLKALSGAMAAPTPASTVASGAPQTEEAASRSVIAQLSDEQQIALGVAAEQSPVYHSVVHLASTCEMKWVRAYMALSAIEESGEVLITIPTLDKLEAEEFELSFEVYFQVSTSIDPVKSRFESIAEIESVEHHQWSANEGADVVGDSSSVPEQSTSSGTGEPDSSQASKAQTGKKVETGQTVRVDVARLDELMNLVGELVIDRTRVAQIGLELAAKYEYDHHIEALAETVGHISRITVDLQDQIMKARMLPIDTVFNRFPRVIRDLSQKVGKEIDLQIEGGETELDRSIIEVIGDPLLHILRNSCDHGIETPEQRRHAGKSDHGTVRLSARHEENHIVISIQDDGAGIDPDKIRAKAISQGLHTKESAEKISDREALNLIFHSGLSTAEKVTDVSGRGVGMDIVRSGIQKLGGIIDIESEVGTGTKFSLRLPLTLAIIRGLLVKVAGVVYVLPLGSVIETLLVENQDVQSVHKRNVIVIRGVTTPLVNLRTVFSTRVFTEPPSDECLFVVIVGLAEQRVGLVVDSLVGEQEVVIKSLSRFCGDVQGISGATILGDGNVALIADISQLTNLE